MFVKIKVTDSGWNGTAFRSGEGILSFTVTTFISAGHVWNYNSTTLSSDCGYWTKVSVSRLIDICIYICFK